MALINVLVAALVFYIACRTALCWSATGVAREHLGRMALKTAHLGCGEMTYLDESTGDRPRSEVVAGESPELVPLLSIHGTFGGADRGLDACRDFGPGFRVIAPSRFGYLGSDVAGEGTPADQARAYVELLDELGVERAFVVATSGGAASALRLAFDHPERVRGLILRSALMPPAGVPSKAPSGVRLPAPLLTDLGLYLVAPLLAAVTGLPMSAADRMLPVAERRRGVELDLSVTDVDMARNYDSYQLEGLSVPALMLRARGDKMTSGADADAAADRIPGCELVQFETGGHALVGHSDEIRAKVRAFVRSAS